MTCTVCNHEQRHDIDRALLAGSATLADLSQKYSLSKSALHRHKQHLVAKMCRAEKRVQDNLRLGYLFKLITFLGFAMSTAQNASAAGDSRLTLQAIREGTRIITLMTKMDLQFDELTVLSLLASPQWSQEDGLLPTDPQIIADIRQAYADDLFSPCPEPEPPADLAEDGCTEHLEETSTSVPATPPSEIKPQPAGLNQNLLEKFFSSLDRSPATQPKTENRLCQKWETSGKLAGKTPSFEENTVDYQKDINFRKLPEKILPHGPKELSRP